MMQRTFPRTALLACAAALLGACDGAGQPGNAQASTPPPAAVQHDGALVTVPEGSPLRGRLQVAEVENLLVERPIQAPGAVEAAPEKLVKITAPLPGRIVALQRTLGDPVRKGDALFTLDSAELSAAYGDAAKGQAALQQARRDLERQKLLFDADIAARKDYEAAQLAFDQAQSDALVSSARLSQLGAGHGASRREYVLRSPIAGRVIEMNAAQGGYWNDINAPIMTVADLGTVFVSAAVSEKDLGAVFAGQKARIVLNAYADQVFEGTVKYVGEVLDPDTRTVKLRVAIDNRDGRLRPGMFAKVVLAGEGHRATVVPPSALLQSGLYTKVFVEKAPFRYEPRTVAVGATVGEHVEVLSGLTPGERIVVKEGVLLHD